MAPATVSAGWLWEMRSVILARVRDRNAMEVAETWAPFLAIYFRMADDSRRNGRHRDA